MELFWFIPTHGDGRYLGTSEGARAVTYSYCKQIAQAADELEEAYRTAELLFPLLPLAKRSGEDDRAFISPFGEMIANNELPGRAAKAEAAVSGK